MSRVLSVRAEGTFQMKSSARSSRVAVSGDGRGLVSQAGVVLLWETMRVTGQSTYCNSVRNNQVGMGSLASLCDLWWHPCGET